MRSLPVTCLSLVRSGLALGLALVVGACSNSDSNSSPSSTDGGTTTNDGGSNLPSDASLDGASDPSSVDSSDGGSDAAAVYVEPENCVLKNDPAAPGQYSDTCVRRSWIERYAGTFTSDMCSLTIRVDGPVAAVFVLETLQGSARGGYVIPWEGGSGAGNDSYFRFTTDDTFARTTALNFTAAERTGTGERSASLRLEGLNTESPVVKASFSETNMGSTIDVDCGVVKSK